MRSARTSCLLIAAMATAIVAPSCSDPVHDQEVQALGPEDPSIPKETADKRLLECRQAVPCDMKIYPDAAHGFLADYRPSYNADAAKDAWGLMLDWFKKYGVA